MALNLNVIENMIVLLRDNIFPKRNKNTGNYYVILTINNPVYSGCNGCDNLCHITDIRVSVRLCFL